MPEEAVFEISEVNEQVENCKDSQSDKVISAIGNFRI